MFPTLTTAQVARVAGCGVTRTGGRGDVLVREGDTDVPFFVVKTGAIEIVRPSLQGDVRIAVDGPGQFTGEMSMLLGRRALMRVRASEAGEVIELTRDQMHALIQTEAEVGEIVMRALVARRTELVVQGMGDAVLIGASGSAVTLRIREFLLRNGHPFEYLDIEQDAGARVLLERHDVPVDALPVLICGGDQVLRRPGNREVAARLGFNHGIDLARVRDVVIVGAGPAGLAAAVYAASEGLDTLVVELNAPGGQAASSSRIENYLGFPTGISGHDLTGRAYAQTQKFGASVLVATTATSLGGCASGIEVELDDGRRVTGRSAIVATGARYRAPMLPNLRRFEGVGVHYSATSVEAAQISPNDEVVVVGGANSAGQAAVFLAQAAARVHLVLRGDAMAASMSRYLIRRIEQHPRICVRTRTEIEALDGDVRLEQVCLRDGSGAVSPIAARHLFLMTGAVANTDWVRGALALDEHGFVRTGMDLAAADLAGWTGIDARPPYPLETSLPGAFAVGDVRCGNVKRVASAVGEGAVVISYVHRILDLRARIDADPVSPPS